jgi:Ca2+-binding RTX toxin-like protein
MAIINLGPGDNTRSGTADDDIINGKGGDDVLSGLAGNDELIGSTGNDVLRGGSGDDFLKGGAGIDHLIGGIGNDTLFGGNGRDVLNGGDGFDFLNGNAGSARLTGGANVDNFQIDIGAERIIITDFKDDLDVLLLDSDFFPGLTIQQILQQHGSSSGGDSAIDLSGTGADAPRIILLGIDNVNKLSDDIVLV